MVIWDYFWVVVCSTGSTSSVLKTKNVHRKGSLLSNECVLERARVEGIEITRVIEVAFVVLTMLPRLMTANKGSSDLTRYHGKFS